MSSYRFEKRLARWSWMRWKSVAPPISKLKLSLVPTTRETRSPLSGSASDCAGTHHAVCRARAALPACTNSNRKWLSVGMSASGI